MTAPTVRGYYNSQNLTRWDVTPVAGDQMWIMCGIANDGAIYYPWSTPTGWTLVRTSFGTRLFTRTATGGADDNPSALGRTSYSNSFPGGLGIAIAGAATEDYPGSPTWGVETTSTGSNPLLPAPLGGGVLSDPDNLQVAMVSVQDVGDDIQTYGTVGTWSTPSGWTVRGSLIDWSSISPGYVQNGSSRLFTRQLTSTANPGSQSFTGGFGIAGYVPRSNAHTILIRDTASSPTARRGWGVTR